MSSLYVLTLFWDSRAMPMNIHLGFPFAYWSQLTFSRPSWCKMGDTISVSTIRSIDLRISDNFITDLSALSHSLLWLKALQLWTCHAFQLQHVVGKVLGKSVSSKTGKDIINEEKPCSLCMSHFFIHVFLLPSNVQVPDIVLGSRTQRRRSPSSWRIPWWLWQ